MSKPAEKHAQILEQILRPFDLSHDFGRKRAYEAAIDYARENLIEDPHCNDFLGAAAKRLGFAPITFDTLESRVKVPKNAWLDVWISDEDEEVAFTGTKEGLQYMIDLLTQLRDATDPEQHIHLDRGMLPMTENSANLVLFKEEESWFTGAAADGAQEFPQREIDDVLDARIASSAQKRSACANRSIFNSKFSGTASMMRSAPRTAGSRSAAR